jgi:hypothetical protein
MPAGPTCAIPAGPAALAPTLPAQRNPALIHWSGQRPAPGHSIHRNLGRLHPRPAAKSAPGLPPGSPMWAYCPAQNPASAARSPAAPATRRRSSSCSPPRPGRSAEWLPEPACLAEESARRECPAGPARQILGTIRRSSGSYSKLGTVAVRRRNSPAARPLTPGRLHRLTLSASSGSSASLQLQELAGSRSERLRVVLRRAMPSRTGAGRQRLKLHRRLHPRLVAGGHHDALHLAAPQLRALGLQRVLARLQPAEPVSPIFCGDCARCPRRWPGCAPPPSTPSSGFE